jgi:phage repressor protein C with HTH and peptisase S24 domain
MDNKFTYIKERFLYVAEIKGIAKEKFCEDIGLTYANFKGKAKLTPVNSDAVANLLSIFPDISPDWLILNQGEIFKDEVVNKLSAVAEPTAIYATNDSIKVPVFDAAFAAGLNGYLNGNNPGVDEFLSVPVTLLKRGAFYAGIRSKGHSMAPTIFDSDRLIVRLLDKCEWMDMRDEHVYAIVDSEGKGYLKRVKNRFEQGFIVCMSDNIDKVNYPNFTMRADEIVSIWHADLHISALMPNINETYYSRLKRLEDKVDLLLSSK